MICDISRSGSLLLEIGLVEGFAQLVSAGSVPEELAAGGDRDFPDLAGGGDEVSG